jgi:DNA-binding transcriptional MerR regulator
MSRPAENSRVRAFAERANVTIKTLRHYDRIGLLRPARTPAGHRLYSPGDLDRLRCIRALKQTGIRLADMGVLLDAEPATLLAHLVAKREAVARERDRLRRVERALAVVEETLRHRASDKSGVNRLADVIEMPGAIGHLRQYFTDDAWAVARGFYLDWPQAHWTALCREVERAIPEGPDTPRAAVLVTRWNTLARAEWRGFSDDLQMTRALHEGFARAWRDRASWPETIRRRFEDYRLDEVLAFLRAASIAEFHRRAVSA